MLKTTNKANKLKNLKQLSKNGEIETALAKDPNLLRTLIDNLPDLIFIKDTEGRFIISNLAIEQVMGAKIPDELIGKTDFDFLPRELAAQYQADDQAVIHSGQPLLNREEPIIDLAGNRQWLSTTKVPLRDSHDHIIGVVGISRDITQRKQAEEASQRLAAILEATNDFVSMTDAEGRALYVNQAGRKMMGIGETEDITTTYISDYCPAWANEVIQSEGLPMAAQAGVWSGETALLHRDGREIPVSQVIIAHKSADGVVEFFSTIARDITEHKQLEQQMDASLERRTHQVQITTEIAQEIAATFALDDIFRRVISLLQERFDYSHIHLYMLQDDYLVLREGAGEAGRQMKEIGHKISLMAEKSLVARAARDGEAVLAPDVFQEPDWLPNPLRPHTKAELAVPIQLGVEVLGVLDVQSESVGGIDEEDQLLLMGLCGQIAVVINNHLAEAERRQAQEALAQERNLLRTLIDNLPDVIYVKDTEGRHLIANHAVVKGAGVATMEELIGKTDLDLYPPKMAAQWYADDMAVIQSGQPLINHEELSFEVGNSIGWDLTTKVPLYDGHGKVVGLVGLTQDITERKRMEMELQKSEALFRATFEEAAIGMDLTDMHGRILVSNLALQKMLGYSAEELQEMASVAEFTHPDDVNEGMRLLHELVRGERLAYQIEKRYLRKDGQVVWGRLTASLVRDEQSRPLFVVGMIEDIIERKQAEDALRKSEEKYRLVVDSVKEVIFQVDTAGCWIFLNPAWTEITGLSVEECLATSYLDYIHSDDIQRHTELFQALLERDIEYYRHASRFLTKEGGERWIEIYAQPTWAADGTILGMSGTLNDISDRKRAEQALRASETRFRILATHVPVGIFETDAQSNCVFINKRWCDLTGMTLAEGLGQGWVNALHPDDRERVITEWNTAAQSGQEFALEYRFQTPAGNVVWVFGNAVTLRNEAGELTGYLGTVTDITESKQVGELLAQRAAQLMLINDIGGKIAAVLDLDSVLDRAAYLVQNTFNYHHVALFLLDNDVARLKAIAGSYTAYFPSHHTQELGQGIIGWVATHSEKVVVNDVSQESRYISKIADQTVTRAELCLPIKVAGQMVGVLDIQSPRLDAFGENDIILMEILVDQIAVAIENARLYQTVQLELAERQQAEEALAKERNLMRTLLDNLPDLIFVKDMECRFLLVNQASLRMGQTTMAEIIGKTDFEINPPELAAQYYADDQAVIQSGQPIIDREERNISTGQLRWFSTTKVPLRDSHGQIIGLVGMSRDVTTRKQVEEALAEERNLLRTLINNIPDSIYVKDMEGRFIIGNPAVAHHMGMTTFDELIGKSDFDFHPQVLAAQFYEKEQMIFKSGQPLIDIEEYYVDRVSGSEGWILTTKVPLRDSQGQLIGLVGVGRDLTQRKQMEEALRQSEERFALAVHGSNDGIWDHDMVNHTLYWSPRLFELFGFDSDELDTSFDKFESRLHPDDEERVKAAIAAHLKGRVPYDVERRGQTKSGEYRWFRDRGQAVWDETGRPLRMVGSSTDITERKQMETALAEERNLLRTLIYNLPDSIYVKDTEGRHLIINQAVTPLHGEVIATMEDVIGKTDLELYPLEVAQQWYADDMAVIQSGQPLLNREELLFEGNKHVGWSLTSKIPLYDGHGKVVGLVGVTRDITEQKRAAEELQQAKEVAETATRVKSEFLANMSHEIRTPLNAVIGMTSLLLDTSLTSEQHDFAETIRTSGDTLLTVINDILDFSKIEAGKLELETQPFDLRQCIEGSLDLVAINAAEKKLELAYLIDDSTPSALVGDVTRLRQILVNLLNNAVKFTEQGEIVLSVRSHLLKPKRAETQESQDQDTESPPPLYEVHVVVRDTGIGIPPDRLDRLFRSFSQVDASTTRKYGGTGLGLTISKRLSELMGGGMWVESEGVPGQGSIFHFTLLAQAAPSQSRIYLRGKNPELTGKHLLIVDDNATNRLILARQAQAWGMRPRAAASAQEGLAWIRRGDSFDLAILDMHMPVMDGLTLAVEIRKYRTAQTLPLVMLTSLGQREDNDQTSQAEFAAFLTKPIKPSHLYNVLSGIFEDQPVKIKSDSPRLPALDHELGQRHPLRILLAEDNAVNQKVALYMLERLGYLADVAANGLEVLEALQRQPYDVVLMDVQMPEMDGLEATQRILVQWPAAQRPWIIAMTANALQGDRERCLAAGMNDYISKPVRPEGLTRALSQCQPRAGRVEVELATEPEVSAARNKSATQVTQSIPVLEAGVLAELRELLGEYAPQMIAELIDLFFETAKPLLEEMRTAVRKEDGLGLRRAAHTIRPGSAHLGATRFAALCEELETIGETGQFDEAAAKLAELEAEFSRVKIALEAEKRGSNG